MNARDIHGFYRLQTADGKFLGFRHHCPVNGDRAATPGRAITHCPTRELDFLNPHADLPVVVQARRTQPGEFTSDAGHSFATDRFEWNGDFLYEKSDPGF